MQFGMGSQSREIRDNLSNFSKFLEHFQPSQVVGGSYRPRVRGTEEARCEDLGRAADEDTRGIASM